MRNGEWDPRQDQGIKKLQLLTEKTSQGSINKQVVVIKHIKMLILIPQKTVAILQPAVDCPVHSDKACTSNIWRKGVMTLKFSIFLSKHSFTTAIGKPKLNWLLVHDSFANPSWLVSIHEYFMSLITDLPEWFLVTLLFILINHCLWDVFGHAVYFPLLD